MLFRSWLPGGAALAVAASLVRPSLAARYTIVLLPALVILLAAGLLAIRPVRARWLVGGLVVALSVMQLGRWYLGPYQDWVEAASIVHADAASAAPGPVPTLIIVPDNRILALRHAALGDDDLTDTLADAHDLATVNTDVRSATVVFESLDTSEAQAALATLAGLGLVEIGDELAGTVHVTRWIRAG